MVIKKNLFYYRRKMLDVVLLVLVCIITFFLILSKPIRVYATETQTNIVVQDELNEEDFKEANEELIQIGRNAKRQRTIFSVSMTRFSQTDSLWSNDIMAVENETIGMSGCYLTSFAMVANYYFPNAGYNPKTINVLMGIYACPFYREIAAVRTDLEIYNYLSRDPMDITVMTDLIAGAMVMERPVIVGMIKANGESHYVVARGYSTTTGEIYIFDPGSSTINTLSAYTNPGGRVTEILVYGR